MIELRWLKRYTGKTVYNQYGLDELEKETVLQYRQKIDTTIRAGMWSNEDIARTATYEWSDWHDVKTVDETQ